MTYLGNFLAGATVRFKWNTNAAAGGSITRGTDGSIRIYKDDSLTQRSSSAGITDTEDFDGLTGLHHLAIDLSDNTDAGFYAAGHEYMVVLVGAVIDGQTVNVVIGHFSIQNRYGDAEVLTAVGALPNANAIADAIMVRPSSAWEAAAPKKSLGAAIMEAIHHIVDDGAGNLIVYRSDGTTEHYRRAIATNVAASPITGLGGAA